MPMPRSKATFKKLIRLRSAKSMRFQGVFKYAVLYDYAAGRQGRYTVLVLNVGNPVTIGRELPLTDVRRLIANYEERGRKLPEPWFGDRATVLQVLDEYAADAITARSESQLKELKDQYQEAMANAQELLQR